jgi:hypothetical protein
MPHQLHCRLTASSDGGAATGLCHPPFEFDQANSLPSQPHTRENLKTIPCVFQPYLCIICEAMHGDCLVSNNRHLLVIADYIQLGPESSPLT